MRTDPRLARVSTAELSRIAWFIVKNNLSLSLTDMLPDVPLELDYLRDCVAKKIRPSRVHWLGWKPEQTELPADAATERSAPCTSAN